MRHRECGGEGRKDTMKRFVQYSSILVALSASTYSTWAQAEDEPTTGAAGVKAGDEVGVSESDEVQALDSGGTTPGSDSSAPWRVGVSDDDAATARTLFSEGNSLVRESVFVPAIEKYEAALKHWDHPAIHYNLSLALLNLEQPLRLREHLVAALKYEGEPLGEEKIRRTKQYLGLVDKQLSHLVVDCKHKGATVKLDDKVVIEAPGSLDEYYEPGRHRLVASAPGYVTNEQDLQLVPGETKSYELKLYTDEEWTRYKRKWAPAGPIALTVSGVVVGGAGGLLFWLGGRQVEREQDRIGDECGLGGCDPGETKQKKTGETMQRIGIATMATGGAAAIVGGILMYVNRKIPYREDPGQDRLSISPVMSQEFAGLIGRGTF